jgi:hypothetical protein
LGRGRREMAGGPLLGSLRPPKGGKAGRAIDWWGRSVAAEASFSERTFSQEFVRARDHDVKNRIDPEATTGRCARPSSRAACGQGMRSL